MIENFESVKKQLSELADAVNKFKSEAVQLRIVELVFQVSEGSEEDGNRGEIALKGSPQPKPQERKPRKKKAVSKASEGAPKSRRTSGRPGPKAMIDSLIEEGYFKQGRTVNEIIEKCSHDKAYQYKNSDFSPTLGRSVRANQLKRAKNDEGQYEYTAG